jgi:hypothetical protein
MKWTTEKRKLKDLIIYDKNPRILTSTQRGEIEKSLKKFDLVEIPAINKDNTIIAGHQRISVLKALKGDDYEIEVRVPETILNEKDFKEYLLRSNRNKAEWDWNMLDVEFDPGLLLEAGFESFEVDVDKLNIENCFADMEMAKKKVKVKECEVCKKAVSMDIKYFIKNKTFDDFNFKDSNDEVKIIYHRLKDILGMRTLHIIIVENNSEDETISS